MLLLLWRNWELGPKTKYMRNEQMGKRGLIFCSSNLMEFN